MSQSIDQSVVDISKTVEPKNLSLDRVEKTIPKVIPLQQAFSWMIDSWEDNHLHWVAPSGLSILTDGSWEFFAAHFANMLRTGRLTDTGDLRIWQIIIYYYDRHVGEHAGRAPVHTQTLELARLDYKQSEDDVKRHGQDHELAKLFNAGIIASAGPALHIRRPD